MVLKAGEDDVAFPQRYNGPVPEYRVLGLVSIADRVLNAFGLAFERILEGPKIISNSGT